MESNKTLKLHKDNDQFMKAGIYHDSPTHCGKVMKFSTKSQRWRCTVYPCSSGRSIKTNSVFDKCRFEADVLSELIKLFLTRITAVQAAKIIDMSESTVCDYFKRFRIVIQVKMHKKLKDFKLGGHNRIVEVDESLFAKVKHHKGKDMARPQVWVFGLKDRESKRVYMEVVNHRRASDLLPIIARHVLPGSIIMSDCWKAYSQIVDMPDYNYAHYAVNHSKNFVHPDNPMINTQSIESSWGAAKQQFKRMRGNKIFFYIFFNKFF